MSAWSFILGAVSDPNTKSLSSTRLSGIACVVSGLTFAFMHPSESASIGVILGGGGLAFFNRAKSELTP